MDRKTQRNPVEEELVGGEEVPQVEEEREEVERRNLLGIAGFRR